MHSGAAGPLPSLSILLSRLYDKMEGIMRTREGLIDALAEAQRKREHSDC